MFKQDNFAKHFSRFYDNPVLADVQFSVSSTETVSAHCSILRSYSRYFFELWQQYYLQSTSTVLGLQDQVWTITLPISFSMSALRYVLKHLYGCIPPSVLHMPLALVSDYLPSPHDLQVITINSILFSEV